MEHLFNCHGEWAILLAALPNLPIIGGLLAYTIRQWFKHDHDHEDE